MSLHLPIRISGSENSSSLIADERDLQVCHAYRKDEAEQIVRYVNSVPEFLKIASDTLAMIPVWMEHRDITVEELAELREQLKRAVKLTRTERKSK